MGSNGELCNYMAQVREYEAQWRKENPRAHPVECYKDMALEICKRVEQDNLKEVKAPQAVIYGGVTEYTYAIAYLAERGIKTIIIEGR